LIVLLIIALPIYFFVVSSCSKQSAEDVRAKNEEREKALADLSIPPVLSDRMKDSSWTIRYWIGADGMSSDCRTAHEYMDDGILEKTVKRRRGAARTYNIFQYLGSCKRAAQRAIDQVSPHVKKWCHYRATDARLNELCEEWEQNGESYISTIQAHYDSTEARFRQITGDAYSEQLKAM
jgi:hypothetical protein